MSAILHEPKNRHNIEAAPDKSSDEIDIHTLLTDHLDIWTAADAESKSSRGRSTNGSATVYGIQKLRGLILELAVRGKLVPQNQSDEPASELIKRIQFERVKLIEQGKLKKQKPQEPVKEELFALPKGWEWVRLDDISPMSLADGDWIESKDQDLNGDIRLVQLADIGVGEFKNKSDKFINSDTFKRLNCTELEIGDILIARLPSPIGRACIFPGVQQRAITVVDVAMLRPLKMFFANYLVNAINSKTFRAQVEVFGKGATRFRIATGNLKSLLIPIPPLAEQHRIVAKVDELMALCDQLDAQHINAAEAHEKLVSHLLDTLTDSQHAEDFSVRWQRIVAYFDTLFTTEASIDALKQTLLQLAVMGKLVPQDKNEEPANELLKRIQDEKSKRGTTSRAKNKILAPVALEEEPFQVPPHWAWGRIGDIALETEYGLSEQTFDSLDGVPVLKMGDIQEGKVILGGQKKVRADVDGLPALYLKPGDLLYNRTNSIELVGKTGIYEGGENEYTFASYLIRIRCVGGLFSPHYLNLVMNTPLFRKTQIEPFLKKQCGQANVNGTIMKNMLVSVPPLKEQHRIVAKVAELMALCDQLKSRITVGCRLQQKVADVMVEQAVA